ncbi:MAG: FAD-binding oxidoreductase [Candidatus Hodarchaeales archaeon]|jgi:D-lactate dehydrogenase (cytochrome)
MLSNNPFNISAEEIALPELSKISQSNQAEKIEMYLNDESKIISGNADCIFFPKSTREVAAIVSSACQLNQPVTVSGGGTGLVGGRVPLKGWIIATDKLVTVDSISSERKYTWKDPDTHKTYTIGIQTNNEKNPPNIRVPVGMILRSVHRLAIELGWFYPPDTTEWSSFIGGNVATNASGARTFKYGPTRKYVEGLRVVLPTGDVLSLNRNQKANKKPYQWQIIKKNGQIIQVKLPDLDRPKIQKNAVGFPQYDGMAFQEIFIGTEGIFGIITEVILQLIPAPTNILSVISFFESNENALSFVKIAQENRKNNNFPIPMSVEFIEENALSLIRRKTSLIPKQAKAVIYLEHDVKSENEFDNILEIWLDLMESTNVIDSWAEMDERGIERHKEFRHALPEEVHHFVTSKGISIVGTDFCVPAESFQELFDFYLELGEKFENYQKENNTLSDGYPSYAMWGHIGDYHLHFNFLPRNKNEFAKAIEFYLLLIQKAIFLNGTVSAEHGVGKKRYEGKPYLEFMIGKKGIEKLRKIKKLLDPCWILNIGNLFD